MSEKTESTQPNHISTVRQLMLDQLRALRSCERGDALADELRRAKGVSELSQTIINSAKVEVEYLNATGQSSTPFLEVPPDQPYITSAPGPNNGITSITRHRLQG
jgi:hypothetical protein